MNQGSESVFPGHGPSGLVRGFLALVVFAGTLGLIALGGGFYCYTAPRQYLSRVVMEFSPSPDGTFVNPYAILQSREVLLRVIREQKLADSWGAAEGRTMPPEEAYARLRARLKVDSMRNTNLINIAVTSGDRVEAANVANQIAVAAQKLRMDEQLKIRDEALGQLREDVAAQRQKTQALRDEALRIAAQEGIAKPDIENRDADNTELSERFQKARNEYAAANHVLDSAQTRLATATVQLKLTVIPAQIWEKAEPAIYPCLPDVLKIMTLATGVGILAGLVMAGAFLFLTRAPRPSLTPAQIRPRQ